jgi:DNA-binding IclR family transcriptional regulator
MKTPSVPSLERGLAVLELLAGTRAGLTLPEISKQLRLPKSSVHTLLVTMERLRYLHRNERTSRYMFGSKLFRIANVSLSGLQVRQVAAPYMHALTERTGLTTHLAVLERNEAVLVEKMEPPGVFKMATWLGKRMDLHCTGVGKTLLSRLADEELSRVLRETGMPRHNDNSITSVRKLKEDLARSRQAGYFADDEEDEIGHRCIAAPILDENGRIAAAVSISGTTAQLHAENFRSLAREVKQTAEAITRALAGRAPGRELGDGESA